ARGYLNQPELTKQRFIQNPFASEADKDKRYTRLYKTGDLVRWLPDGNLEYLGRNDFQVKLRGFRIELAEIEQALLTHAAIQEAVVLAQAKQEGEPPAWLVAYYVGNTIDENSLIQQLASTLPDYMIPHAFIRLERLPLTSNGKLDRQALP
ncbi:AMP-binding enzyme, partial [Legionella oakridgensis]|uniref:AMP-binding enzyme n=1 Tax=Legionella oakridgensis TaxID=29423 RepID=UPI00056681AA